MGVRSYAPDFSSSPDNETYHRRTLGMLISIHCNTVSIQTITSESQSFKRKGEQKWLISHSSPMLRSNGPYYGASQQKGYLLLRRKPRGRNTKYQIPNTKCIKTVIVRKRASSSIDLFLTIYLYIYSGELAVLVSDGGREDEQGQNSNSNSNSRNG